MAFSIRSKTASMPAASLESNSQAIMKPEVQKWSVSNTFLPAAFTADDGVYFSHPSVRVLADECLIILVGASFEDSGVRDF